MIAKATQEAVFRTADLVIERIGGSKTTVHRHLSAWWQQQPRTAQDIEDATVVQAEQRLHDLLPTSAARVLSPKSVRQLPRPTRGKRVRGKRVRGK
jgi:hypothetical protein